MFAQAIYTTGGSCERSEPYDFGAMLRAMTGGRGGQGGRSGSGERGRHRRHGYGPGPGGGFGGFPFGAFGPGGGPRGRGRKARRGDIRTAALLLLAEEPRNGYQIMQEVEERSDGAWRPSPGSVYPALQQLEDEGLIRSQETDGRKLFALTDEGRAYVAERDESAPAPWQQMSGDISDGARELGTVIREVTHAFVQIVRTGSEGQMAKAREVLVGARRDLYRILADGNGEEGSQESQESQE
jgi:DNA-binding PadR family transcriptional regulator